MSEEISEQGTEPQESPILIGETLRSTREAKSMTVSEVARRLNLEEHVVQSLEQDSYESLPEPAYIRGYLLAYIRLMDLPISILKPFDVVNQADKPLLMTNHSVQSSCSQDGWVKCISTGLVVLLVIVLVLWVLEQSFNVFDTEPARLEQTDTMIPVVVEQAVSVEVFSMENELKQSAGTTGEILTDEVSLSGDPSVEQPASEDVSQTELKETSADGSSDPAALDAEQSDKTPVLTMKFSAATWIRIDDDKGNRLEAGTYQKGQDITLSHDGQLHLIIGRTQNVELSYDGEPVDLSRFSSAKVARLKLGQLAE